jgi:transcription elongation GreA/GreB family factor
MAIRHCLDTADADRQQVPLFVSRGKRSMSRAFVKDADDTFDELPDRPVSPHPNLVTPEGLAAIEATLTRLHEDHAAAQRSGDRAALATAARDLRYWTARRASAQRVAAPANPDAVHFGSTVTILRDDGRRQTWRIVGEDEAEPARGTISYVSPVARALMGKAVGDVVRAGHSDAEIVDIA